MKITLELTDAELLALQESIAAEIASRVTLREAQARGETPEHKPGQMSLQAAQVSVEMRQQKTTIRSQIDDARMQVVKLLLEGQTAQAVAEIVGVPLNTVSRWKHEASKRHGIEFPAARRGPRPRAAHPNREQAIAEMLAGATRVSTAKKHGVSEPTVSAWKKAAVAAGVDFPKPILRHTPEARRKMRDAAKARRGGVQAETEKFQAFDVYYFDRGRLGKRMVDGKTLAECHDIIKTLLNVQRLWPVGTGPDGALETFMNPEKGMKDGYCVMKTTNPAN